MVERVGHMDMEGVRVSGMSVTPTLAEVSHACPKG